jgi:hypothetical protein
MPGAQREALPAHRSKLMRAWLGRQRSWLVVEPLPGYAPELNPVEPLWASLKEVELANLAGSTLEEVTAAAEHGIRRIRGTRTWPTRSCGTAACRCGDHAPGTPTSSAAAPVEPSTRRTVLAPDPRAALGRCTDAQ